MRAKSQARQQDTYAYTGARPRAYGYETSFEAYGYETTFEATCPCKVENLMAQQVMHPCLIVLQAAIRIPS